MMDNQNESSVIRIAVLRTLTLSLFLSLGLLCARGHAAPPAEITAASRTAESVGHLVSEEYGKRAWKRLPDGGVEYSFSFRVKGDTDSDSVLIISCDGAQHFKVSVPSSSQVPAGKEVSLPIKATLDEVAAAALPPFTLDKCNLVFDVQSVGKREKQISFPVRLATPAKLTPPGKEYLEAIRARVAKEERAKRLVTRLAKEVDSALAELGSPIEPPTEGNWIQNDRHTWHWPQIVKLETGADGAKTCPECGRVWTTEQLKTSARCRKFRTLFADLGLVAMATGNERYAQSAREMLKGLARVYGSWPVGKYGARIELQVGPEAQFDGEALVCIRRLRTAGMLSDADLKEIAAGWLIPSVEMVLSRGAGTPNLAISAACSVGMLGLVLDWPPYVAASLRDEKRGYLAITKKRIGEDGGWQEGSLSYHMTTEHFIIPLPAELKLYGFDVMQEEKEFGERLRRFYRFPILAMRPDGRLPAIADGGLGNPKIPDNAIAYWVTREPCLIPWLNSDLEFQVDSVSEAPKSEFKSHNFPDFGIAVLHDGGALGRENWALIRHGKHEDGHGHFDMLNVVSYSHGQPLHDDVGSNYGTPLHWSWARNTVSHCTLAVDEKCQRGTTGNVEFLSIPDKGPQVIVVSDDGAYEGVHLERAIIFVNGIQLFVDRAVSSEEHDFDWIFTCYGKVAGTSDASKKIPCLTGKAYSQAEADKNSTKPTEQGVGYDLPHNLQEMKVKGNWWIDWEGIKPPYAKADSKPVAMRWLGWSSNPVQVIWGDAPGLKVAPDLQRWVKARQHGREAVWVTALVPQEQPALLESMEVVQPTEGKGLGVQLKSTAGESLVAINWASGKPLRVGPVTTTVNVVVQPAATNKR